MNDHDIGRRKLVLPVAITGLALIAAACSGGSGGPRVAGAGGDTSTTASQSASTGAAKATSLKYSRCMRSHGISDFPDPDGNGEISISVTAGPGQPQSDLDPASPTFKAAQTACKAYAPDAGTPAEKAARRASTLKYSQCMRSHGISSFPDPNSDGGLTLNATAGGDLDPNSPQFKSADKACQKFQPKGGKGGGMSVHSETK